MKKSERGFSKKCNISIYLSRERDLKSPAINRQRKKVEREGGREGGRKEKQGKSACFCFSTKGRAALRPAGQECFRRQMKKRKSFFYVLLRVLFQAVF